MPRARPQRSGAVTMSREAPVKIHLPKGLRADDPLRQEHGFWMDAKFRLGLLARKFPIQVALLLSLAVVSYPVILLVNAKNDLKEATQAIQNSREEVLLADCRDQNKRHDDTTKSLVDAAQIDQNNAPTEAAKLEIRRRRDVTLALIDALAPHADCEAAVRKLKPTS